MTNILNGNCIMMGSAPVGDFDGDGTVGMDDLLRAIRFFKGEPDDLLQSVYLGTPSIGNLVTLVRNYVNGIQDQ
jgi:hypothetical protein